MLSEKTKEVIRRKVKFALESQRQMKREGLRPESLTMLSFDSQGDYESFYAPGERIEDEYPAFNETAGALVRSLDDVGLRAELAVGRWPDYLKWLAGRQHSARTRTEYAAYLGASKHVDPSKIKAASFN